MLMLIEVYGISHNFSNPLKRLNIIDAGIVNGSSYQKLIHVPIVKFTYFGDQVTPSK